MTLFNMNFIHTAKITFISLHPMQASGNSLD
jgi:hypothetical protein